jgi:dolichol-phosphate mannosyltransferase
LHDMADSTTGEAGVKAVIHELTVVAPTFNERANVGVLVERLHAALDGHVAWQVIFVDDNSPDGTAEAVKAIAARDPRVSCIRRVRRRGLAGAVVEGALASAAPYVAVIDADLQHDETLLPRMLSTIKAENADLVIASRYVGDGEASEGLSRTRELGSRLANSLGRLVLRQNVSDPVSGFFMIRRERIEQVAPRLTTEGFKILFDVIASQTAPMKIVELPYTFRERLAGGSKLDRRIVIDYLGLLLSKLSGGVIPSRALMFGLVGATGVVINVGLAWLILAVWPTATFALAQFIGAVVAMTSNYLINNEITYRDRRKHGWTLAVGYLKFCALCSVGLAANVAVGAMVHQLTGWKVAASMSGTVFGALWNYATTALAVW